MKSAHLYLPLGWRLVPLHSVRADDRCTCGHTETAPKVCECGDPACSKRHGEGSIGKHPRIPGWANAASSDPDEIVQWGARWPGCNVGVATGQASGVIVLDVDTYKGGAESLAALEAKHGALPRTAISRTGGGGLQYFFQAGDTPIHNSAGRLGRGLDFRAEGGQVVLPPSVSGRGPYSWVHAPWDVPPAPAPSWLLAPLGRSTAPAAAPSERGHFPAATLEVLEQAAEALANHGPAVDGDGGGLHTVHAAAILTHDFALTEEEAWPLFEAWNRTCVPPWDLEELRVRLARGLKYGKRDFGCRRELDHVQAAQKRITDWEDAGSDRDTMLPMMEAVREILRTCADPLRRELIERELHRATGISVRALKTAKPPPAPIPLKQGEIRLGTDLHRVADEATAALAPLVFQRNGILVEVVVGEQARIKELETARITDLMSRSSTFVRQDENKGMVRQTPPEPVARIIHARRSHSGVRVLEAVTSAPVFLIDGSILHERGYNEAARLYLDPSVAVVIPEHPTRDHAVAAVRLFQDLLSDFRFASPADFSSWFAALLSTLVKSATRNASAPLFIVSAPAQGSGKSLLTKIIAQVVTGTDPELRPYNPRDEGEWGKRITSYVKAGLPLAVFDNITGTIGDPLLDALLTSARWSDRQLGASEAPALPNVTTWMATGNNLEPHGDTVRRSLIIRIETMEERPEIRSKFKLPLEFGYALEHRGALLGAALTLLRAYHLAGRPAQRLAPWGSFGAWSSLVRGALVWAGCSDPSETQRRAQLELNEGEHEAHDFWLGVVAASDGSPAGIVLVADQRGAAAALGLREQLTPHRLRLLLARFVDKVRKGKRIRKTRGPEGTRYHVESVPI